jgi:hypothetical protein
MSPLLCSSYEPFQLLYHDGDNINDVCYHNGVRSSYKCNEEIKYIILKSFQTFFTVSANYITEYKITDSLQEQNKIIIKNRHLNCGVYNTNNKILYCVNKCSVYLIDEKGVSCCFPNIRKYLIDKYRFFSFDTRHFLKILQYNNYCVLDTKKSIEKMLQLLWKYTNSFKIKFQCIFQNHVIFLCEINKKKNLVFINSKTFLLEFLEIHNVVGDYPFYVVGDTFLYLIVCIPNIHSVYLQYHIVEANNIYSLFESTFYYPNSEDIQDYCFYFFQSQHYVHIFTKEGQNVLYLFHIQEKLKLSLQYEKTEKLYLKQQYQYFQSILYKKNNRIENDIATKTLGKCCICYENNVNILFLPCSHICVCSLCGLKETVSSCPMCRHVILVKKTAYILTK